MPASVVAKEFDALPRGAVYRPMLRRSAWGTVPLLALLAFGCGRRADSSTQKSEPGALPVASSAAAEVDPSSTSPRVAASTVSAAPPAACPEGMSKVTGGTFWVGSAGRKGPEDEHPRFQARVGDFCLDRTEVTAGAYDACVEQKQCGPHDPDRSNLTCNLGRAERKQHPANCVTWREANAYCAGLGKRLPTEVEWEYAARGGAEYRAFSFGAGSPDDRVCWKSAMSCEVGSYPAGAFELWDMAGNVWEWTATRYGPYPFGEVDNPNRVYRGGSWSRRFDKWLSPTLRNRFDETKWGSHLGFRCAADLPGTRCGNPAAPSACPLEVTDAECGPETTWNGVRCARPGAPLCRPGAHPVPGSGCQRDVPLAVASTTEPTGEAVVFDRSPEFDADCREFQPERPEAYRLSHASHPERTQAGARRGCKNRDVGVGWNSACCPLR